jgi:DNA-binding response OmpR family regulator
MIRLAIVEDEPDILDEITFVLRHEGFLVSPCASATVLDQHLVSRSFDVVLLDIGLPGEDGFAIARRLRRSHPQTGIVFLTARTQVADRIHGMEEGADAYLSKPVDFRELALVIRAVVRRLAPVEGAVGLVLALREQRLHLADGRSLALTRSETLLLSGLARAPARQASRQQLVEALGERYNDYDPRRLEALISRLRKKLTLLGSEEEVLRAVRQAGYYFALPLSERDSAV